MRVLGTVVGAPHEPLAWCSLTVGGETRAVWRARCPLVVRLDDGVEVSVDVEHRDLELHPVERTSGTWPNLEKLEAAEAFRDVAPAPHLRVTLEHARVKVGDRISVLGEALDDRQGGGGLREPARERRACRAHAIGVGEAGARAVEAIERDRAATERLAGATRAPPRRWGHWVWIAVALTSLLFAARSLGIGGATWVFEVPGLGAQELPLPHPWAFDLASLGLFYVALAVLWVLEGARLPVFIRGEARVPPVWRLSQPTFLAGFATAPMVLLFGAAGDARWEANANGAPLTAALSAAAVLALLALGLRSGLPSLRYARLLLGASTLEPGAPSGTWGAVTGRVDDPTPLFTAAVPAAIALVEDEEIVTGSSPNIDRARLLCKETFFVTRASVTTRIEVDPRDAVWASAVRIWPREADRPKHNAISTEIVPIGASILLVGRSRRDGDHDVVRSHGPESLLFYASAPGTDGRRLLLRGSLMRVAGLALIAAIALAIPLLTAAATPLLPPFNPVVADSD